MKKLISAVAATALAGSMVLTGCSSGSQAKTSNNGGANGPVTLSFWAGVVTPDRDAFYKKYVDKVHEKYPNITIDYLGIPGSWDDYNQKLDVAISAGSAPDLSNHFMAKHITDGFYLPLDDYINKWSDKDKLNKNLIEDTRNYDPKDHKLYGLTYSTQIQVLYEKPDYLKAANLSDPTEWSDFFNDVKTLTDKSKDIYGLSIRGGSGSASQLEFLMYGYSGITDYFDKNGKSTINDPKNIEFVEKYLGMYNVYTPQDDLTKTWTQLASTYQTGKAAFIAHNLGSASSMDKAFNGDSTRYKAISFPKSIQGYVLHSGLQPSALSVGKTSKDPQQAFNAATVFVDKDLQVDYSKIWGEIPSNNEAGNDPFFKNTPYMQTGIQIINSDTTKFSNTPYYLPNYTSIEAKMEPMIQKVMTKQMTAKDMLDQWAKLLEQDKAAYDAATQKK